MNNQTASIPTIRLSVWEKIIIFLEDHYFLPSKYLLTWYDPIILVTLILLTVYSVRSNLLNSMDLGVYLMAAILGYISYMTIRHINWLIDHAKDTLFIWGDQKQFELRTPNIDLNILKQTNWHLAGCLYAETKNLSKNCELSIFAAELWQYKYYSLSQTDKNKIYKTLTFAYLYNLPYQDKFHLIIRPKKYFSTRIFNHRQLKYLPNLTGVNEFDRRYQVCSDNGSQALRFLNPVVILALLHLSLPHEILVFGNGILISSSRHFTRVRVLDELYAISQAIYDAHGGNLTNSEWDAALRYFHQNPYHLNKN